ncbi:MAG: hypothetical protein CM1200mP10_13110 [Candidatus Neomarinimicrobiota bacterium]|nr:MAG: hypothetical protein CM1200mP10_13110 [Candidatus Neomarinimicrobiota bacterium]
MPEARIVEVAVQSLGLNNVSSFVPKEKIIDYPVSDSSNKLAGMSVQDFPMNYLQIQLHREVVVCSTCWWTWFRTRIHGSGINP